MKRIAVICLAVVLVFVSGLAMSCSNDNDNKEIAMQVAKDWTSTEIDYITDEIAGDIWLSTFSQTEIPITVDTLRSIIKEQVSNNLTWTYNEEYKASSTTYHIEARTTLTYDIPQIGNGNVDIGFVLTCSSKYETVSNVGKRIHSSEYISSPEYLSS